MCAGLLLFVCSCLIYNVHPAKILMQPFAYGMNSRFMAGIKLAEILIDRGHNVTVLINSDDKKAMEHIQVCSPISIISLF